MKRSFAALHLFCLGLLPKGALAVELKGPEELTLMTQQVIAACSGTGGLVVSRGGGDLAEERMTTGAQQTAALYGRFLDETTCASSQPTEADGLLIGLDGVVAAVDTDSAASCGSALAESTTLPVTELNGVPGLQCPGCVGSSYHFTSWRDVLRILYAGLPESAGQDLALRDCNSDLRRSLANSYSSIFQASCSGSSCSSLGHAFRPGDTAGAAELLVGVLALPAIDLANNVSPFCNAFAADVNDPALQSCSKDADCASFDCFETTPVPPETLPGNGKCRVPRRPYYSELQDGDPIRRTCLGSGELTAGPPNEPTEQVCDRFGTLGLVLPIQPPMLGIDAPTPFPTKYCSAGVFALAPAIVVEERTGSPAVTIYDRCPNGDRPIFNSCLWPIAADNDPACINGKDNLTSFRVDTQNSVGPASAQHDGRVYNRYLRKGNAATNPGLNRFKMAVAGRAGNPSAELVGAFYRLHTTRTGNTPANVSTCSNTEPGAQAGCLAQASPCSVALAAKRAGLQFGTKNLSIAGIDPTVASIQRVLTAPPDPLTYPLSAKVFFSAMRGLDKVTESTQWNLGQCMESKNKVQAAATFAGLVPLGVDPSCTDFDERVCGNTFNADGCSDGANLCPHVGVFSVSPLTTSVGGHINVASTGSDPDGSFVQFLWTASAGSFANPEASSTRYTCTQAGDHTITVTVADSGACTDSESALVHCL